MTLFLIILVCNAYLIMKIISSDNVGYSHKSCFSFGFLFQRLTRLMSSSTLINLGVHMFLEKKSILVFESLVGYNLDIAKGTQCKDFFVIKSYP